MELDGSLGATIFSKDTLVKKEDSEKIKKEKTIEDKIKRDNFNKKYGTDY